MRTIEIRLTDEQHAAVMAEAKAAGTKFFDYCRAKLLLAANPNRAVPMPQEQFVTTAVETDRIGRLEAMMAQMGEAIHRLAEQGRIEPDSIEQGPAEPVDIEDIVNGALKAAGEMVIEEVAPQPNGGVRHIGRRPPTPFTAGAVPRHVNQAFEH